MLDFNNGQPQRPHAGSFGATASDEARQASGGGRPPQPEAPRDYDKMPNLPALAELKNIPQWVAWNYEWRKARQDWVKMPSTPAQAGTP
jgi:hypothetical protein